jgi:hypothetical protein
MSLDEENDLDALLSEERHHSASTIAGTVTLRPSSIAASSRVRIRFSPRVTAAR